MWYWCWKDGVGLPLGMVNGVPMEDIHLANELGRVGMTLSNEYHDDNLTR
jgi:hypothetical protein